MPDRSLKSRKFLAQMFSSLALKTILAAALVVGIKEGAINPWLAGVCICVVFVDGFRDVGYILGQASLDKYLILADKGVSAAKALKGGKPDA